MLPEEDISNSQLSITPGEEHPAAKPRPYGGEDGGPSSMMMKTWARASLNRQLIMQLVNKISTTPIAAHPTSMSPNVARRMLKSGSGRRRLHLYQTVPFSYRRHHFR